MKKRRIILKLSGESLAGKLKVGIDPLKVKEIAQKLKSCIVKAISNYQLW